MQTDIPVGTKDIQADMPPPTPKGERYNIQDAMHENKQAFDIVEKNTDFKLGRQEHTAPKGTQEKKGIKPKNKNRLYQKEHTKADEAAQSVSSEQSAEPETSKTEKKCFKLCINSLEVCFKFRDIFVLLNGDIVYEFEEMRDENIDDLKDKTIIVTGANSGIGYYSTLCFLYKGAHVIMACRNLDKANKAKENLAKAEEKNNDKEIVIAPRIDPNGNVFFCSYFF